MDQQPYNNQPPYGQQNQPPAAPPQPGVPPQGGFQPPMQQQAPPPQPGFQPLAPPPFPPQQGFPPMGYQQPFNTNKANAALVLGIISLVCGLALTFAYGLFFIVGFVCSIVGLVFSVQLRKAGGGGNVNASFVLNIIGLIVNSIWIAICTIGVVFLAAGLGSMAGW